jgi:hypothetical protein
VESFQVGNTNLTYLSVIRNYEQAEQGFCTFFPIGTRSDVDRTIKLDTFLFPLVEDLKKLAVQGVPARRWQDGKLDAFTLRAHLVLMSGDMPAIAKVHFAQ